MPIEPVEDFGTGAFEIGGGYGQGIEEADARAVFEVPAYDAGNAMTVLSTVLRGLPLDSLKKFQPMIPGAVEDDFSDSDTATDTIVGAMDQRPPLLELLDSITGEFLGQDTVIGSWLDDARGAMGKIFSGLSQNTRSIQDLQAKEAGAEAQGKVVTVDFSEYPDGPIPNDLFDVVYHDPAGPSTSQLGIEDGVVQWTVKDPDEPRDVYCIFKESTETDFQIMRGTMDSPPGDPTDSGQPYFYAVARVSADRQSYVWARAWSTGSWFQFRGDMGCMIDGVEHVWVSDVPLTWSLDMSFLAGVGNNPRQFQVWSGNKLVHTHTEDELEAPLSHIGEDYRQWGSLNTCRPGGIYGVHTGGKIAGCSVADNELPSVRGTTSSYYRISPAKLTFPGANAITPLPANFWEIPSRSSRNIGFNPATGAYTVVDEGLYLVHGRVNVADNKDVVGHLILQVNGTTVQWGDSTFCGDVTNTGLSGSWVEYLYPGDVVNLATEHGGFTTSSINGEATGTKSFFDITGIGVVTAA